MAQFSVSWDAFKQSICNGLTTLQQNGELVDVTLAADGHLVRVHRLVLSLVSPYLKELLASAAECKNPVVFLHRVSYQTLCSILEYAYTGQATVNRDQLLALVQAAKELQIKGLEDMDIELKLEHAKQSSQEQIMKAKPLHKQTRIEMEPESDNTTDNVKESVSCVPLFKISNPDTFTSQKHSTTIQLLDEDSFLAQQSDHHTFDHTMDTDTDQDSDWKCDKPGNSKDQPDPSKMEYSYTISNQGRLQMILNRYIYNLKYTSSKGADIGHRRWRCKNYGTKKINCKAVVVTINDVVAKRCFNNWSTCNKCKRVLHFPGHRALQPGRPFSAAGYKLLLECCTKKNPAKCVSDCRVPYKEMKNVFCIGGLPSKY